MNTRSKSTIVGVPTIVMEHAAKRSFQDNLKNKEQSSNDNHVLPLLDERALKVVHHAKKVRIACGIKDNKEKETNIDTCNDSIDNQLAIVPVEKNDNTSVGKHDAIAPELIGVKDKRENTSVEDVEVIAPKMKLLGTSQQYGASKESHMK